MSEDCFSVSKNRSIRQIILGARRDEVTGGLEETTLLGVEWSVLLTLYCSGDKIEKNETRGACSAYGGGERRVEGFGGET